MAKLDDSMEKTRRRSEDERNALVLEANQDGVFDADLLTGQTYYSAEWLAQIGYRPGELPGTAETWQERIHADDRERVQEALDAYLARRQPVYRLDYRIRHRDGHWCWLHVCGKAVWNEDGQAIRLVGSHKDITDRKNAEAELKASETRLRTFLDHNPAITFIKDEDGRMVYTNASANRLFQLEGSGWIGKLDAEIWPAEVAAELRANDLAVLQSGICKELLESVPLADGTLRHFISTKFAFRDASGTRALGGLALDVTEQRRVEAELRDSEARYRELFERNPLPGLIYQKDDFKIVDVNQAAIEHYGWTREEFLSMTVRDIRVPEEFDAVEAHLEGSRTGIRTNPHWRHRRKDGTIILAELTALDLKSGTPPLRVALANDVTARVQAEQEILFTNEMLEGLVRERTRELHDSKLLFQALVESSPQMIWAVGPNGETEFLNPAALGYVGLALSDLAGDRWLRSLHPDDMAHTAIYSKSH